MSAAISADIYTRTQLERMSTDHSIAAEILEIAVPLAARLCQVTPREMVWQRGLFGAQEYMVAGFFGRARIDEWLSQPCNRRGFQVERWVAEVLPEVEKALKARRQG